eukprot:scpid109859/ scgid23414/ 
MTETVCAQGGVQCVNWPFVFAWGRTDVKRRLAGCTLSVRSLCHRAGNGLATIDPVVLLHLRLPCDSKPSLRHNPEIVPPCVAISIATAVKRHSDDNKQKEDYVRCSTIGQQT